MLDKEIEGAYYYTLDLFQWGVDTYLPDPSIYVIGYPYEYKVLVPFVKDHMKEDKIKSIYIPFMKEMNTIKITDVDSVY